MQFIDIFHSPIDDGSGKEGISLGGFAENHV